MKILWAASALFILTACGPGKSGQINSCEMEAARVYAARPGDTTNLEIEYTGKCMVAHGYELTVDSKDCSVDIPFREQTACYQSKSLLAETWRSLMGQNSN